MDFPLTAPDDDAVAALHKTWNRHKLDAYLRRWADSRTPEPPAEFWAFEHRAVDVGCGFGKYILATSEQRSDWGWLGIDKGGLRGGAMVDRIQTADRSNLFGLHGNAIPILAAMPDASLDQITLFYPNPWWPAKHRKKRWSYHPLAPKLVSLLKPGGLLLLTSNEAFYLSEWDYALSHHPDIQGRMTREYVGSIQVEEGRSHFEVKFIEEGTPCGEVRYRKANEANDLEQTDIAGK